MARPSGGMLLETLLSILLKHTAGYSAGLPLYAAVTGTQSTAQPVPSKGPGEKICPLPSRYAGKHSKSAHSFYPVLKGGPTGSRT